MVCAFAFSTCWGKQWRRSVFLFWWLTMRSGDEHGALALSSGKLKKDSLFATPLPQRSYVLPPPRLWEAGSRTDIPDGCIGVEYQRAVQVLNQTFEDIETHIVRNAYVAFLGAVLEVPHGRHEDLELVVLPGLPGSLQIVTTMIGLAMIDAGEVAALLEKRPSMGSQVVRLPLSGLELEDFTAVHFVDAARENLGVQPTADLWSISHQIFHEKFLWQSVDELRYFQWESSCDLRFDVVERSGVLINLLHGYATNYYHFLTEQMPALIAFHADLSWVAEDKITILYLGHKWQAELIQLAGFTHKQLQSYDPCKVYRADLVYTAAVPDSKSAELLLQTRASVLPSGFGMASTKVSAERNLEELVCFRSNYSIKRRILIVERRCVDKSGNSCVGEAAGRGRSITNFEEVLGILKLTFPASDGFAVCSFRAEEHSVFSQAAHFEAADLVIGAIGAGLTNLIFMRPGSLVVALHPSHPQASFSTYSSRCGQSYFWQMSSQLGLSFWAFLCPEMTLFEGGRVDKADFKLFLSTVVQPSFIA